MNHTLKTTIDSILEFAWDLLQIPGISGYEDEVARYFDSKAGSFGAISHDYIGNCFLRTGSCDSNLKILVTAHMDSVGFIVKDIESKYEASLLPVGLYRLDQYDSARARVMGENQTVSGLILLENEKIPKFVVEQGEFTLGEANIEMGDQVVAYNPPTTKEHLFLNGTWLDNRLGLSVLMNLAKKVPNDFPADVLMLASVREEIGAKGVEAALKRFQPDFAIVIDATWTQSSVNIGQGPVLTIWDPSVIVKPRDRRIITKLASELNIPLQREILGQGSSDAGPLTRAGIPTFCIMFPVEGLHTPIERAALEDVAWNFMLIRSLLETLESMKIVC
ncbi:MAG: M20/M25/M40 family metallo-hydrolase [Candidatus Heimdallarchaeota archaeon]